MSCNPRHTTVYKNQTLLSHKLVTVTTMLPDDVIKSLEKKYRQSTIKTMNNNIKRIFIHALKTETYKTESLYEIDKIKPYLEDQSLGMRKTLIANILGLLKLQTKPKTPKAVIKKWEKYFDNVCKEYADKSKYKESSEKEKANHIPMSDIKDILATYEKKAKQIEKQDTFTVTDMIIYEKYIILYLYTTIPPLRSEDYYKMLLTISRKDNYINLKTKMMYIKVYKTSKTYGTRKIKLTPELNNVLKKWVEIQKKFNPEIETIYLMPTISSKLTKPQSQQGFTDLLNRIFAPKKISSSMLRKIYISEIIDKQLSPDERKEITKIMGHSLEMQEFIYSRFSDNIHKTIKIKVKKA